MLDSGDVARARLRKAETPLSRAERPARRCKCGHTIAQHAHDSGRECNSHIVDEYGQPPVTSPEPCPCEHFTLAETGRIREQLSLPGVPRALERSR
jgi:hypothetical protein